MAGLEATPERSKGRMNGNVFLAIVILGWLLVGCVLMVIDIYDRCDEALVDELWEDDEPASWSAEV